MDIGARSRLDPAVFPVRFRASRSLGGSGGGDTSAAGQGPPLIELLDDPDVRQWLAAKQTTATAVMPSAAHASRLVAGIRLYLSGMRQAIPRVVPERIAAREAHST